MHIAPAHGDVGIHGAGVPFLLLRPSLGNIASLGDPAEIIAIFESVMGAGDRMQIVDAMGVLWACIEGDARDAEKVLGYFCEEYEKGTMEDLHKIHLARHLLLHGMIGDVESTKPATGKPIKEFKAAEFVSLAIAHLGMSQAEAWGLSMTALVSALNAKFPEVQKPNPEGNAPTIDEHDATMAWFDSIRGTQ